MSIYFGSSNTTRYYTCPDHADFTLTGGHTWLAVMAPDLTNTSEPKYLISTGGIDVSNSANLFVTSSGSSLGYSCNGPTVQTTVAMSSGVFTLSYGRRISGNVSAGAINLTTKVHEKSPGATSSNTSNGGTLTIGGRNDLSNTRMFRGWISWVALLNVGLSDADLDALAAGTKKLVDDFNANIVEYWDTTTPSATITGKKKGHVLTRSGTGYGTDGADPLPYSSGSIAITFNGTAPNQSGNVGTLFNFDIKPFFSGTQTPFAYSVQAGTLPVGLSLTNGVITGNPTTAETKSGIVIRGTDSGSATADSNAFSITISTASIVVKGIKIILNTRATLLPVGAMSNITARYWDSPTASGAPLVKTDTATISASGEIVIDIDGATSLPIGGTGYLSLYKQGAAPENDLHFAGRVPVSDIS